MTQTMHYLAEARGALVQAGYGLRGSGAQGSPGQPDLHDLPGQPGLDGSTGLYGSRTAADACSSDACVAPLGHDPVDTTLAAFTNRQLLESTVLVEEISRELDVFKARFAADIAWRSRPELGNAGLASVEGHLNPESLLRSLTRSSFQDAARRIRVGTVLAESEASAGAGLGGGAEVAGGSGRAGGSGDAGAEVDDASLVGAGPFDAIASALLGGDLGVEGADRVIRALAPVAAAVEPDVLRQATNTLAVEGATCNTDELGTMARGVRDTLDRLGVADRERHLREQRSLRKSAVIDGLRRVTLVLDPESDVILTGAIEAAMSPRLGGPRFADTQDQDRAARMVDDPRSNEQMALDVLIDLVRIGVDRDDGTILGSVKPALRVTIPFADLTRAVDTFGHE
ncbi:MAG: hypothetical protein QOE16_933, partial [Microbacteriaceae bacterium]|nr:hypothetical protein [Microbacteriaceae bacterium]